MANKENILRPYAMQHVGSIYRDIAGMMDEIAELRVYPGRNGGPREVEKRIGFIENVFIEEINYLRKVLRDLEKVKT